MDREPTTPRGPPCLRICAGTLGRGGGSAPDCTVYVQVYVLFPSLMRPPMWLRRDFTQVKTARVQVGPGRSACAWRARACICACSGCRKGGRYTQRTKAVAV
jgi:hypothetical protein